MYFLFKNNVLFSESVKLRPVEEFININFYRPLAFIVLLPLWKFQIIIKPELIVIFHTLLIFLAAFIYLFFSNDFFFLFVVFLLINLKVVLDNLDGQYSRVFKLESELGRYLDTVMDFIGDLALFIVIGIKHNNLVIALVSFLVFTFILSYDFNLEYLYRKSKGQEFRKEVKDQNSFYLFFLNPFTVLF